MIEKNYFELALERVKAYDISRPYYENKFQAAQSRIATLVLLFMEHYRRNALCLKHIGRDHRHTTRLFYVPYHLVSDINIDWAYEELPEDVIEFIESIENITLHGAVSRYLTWHYHYKELLPLGYLDLPKVHEPMLYYAQIIDYHPRMIQTKDCYFNDLHFMTPEMSVFSQIETPFILLTEEDFAAKDKEYEALGDKFWDKYLRPYVKVFER